MFESPYDVSESKPFGDVNNLNSLKSVYNISAKILGKYMLNLTRTVM